MRSGTFVENWLEITLFVGSLYWSLVGSLCWSLCLFLLQHYEDLAIVSLCFEAGNSDTSCTELVQDCSVAGALVLCYLCFSNMCPTSLKNILGSLLGLSLRRYHFVRVNTEEL